MLKKSKKKSEVIFNAYTFEVSEHAIDQWCGGRFDKTCREKAKTEIPTLIKESVFLGKKEDHLYYRNKDFIFPCVVNGQIIIVKTVLTVELYENLVYKP